MKNPASSLIKLDKYRYQLPQDAAGCMRVPGIIYTSAEMLGHIAEEQVVNQVANVACLPGIVKYSLAMPDVHWGYGFPIGGVAAMDIETGVVSPGGVGFDINCGVRLLRTNLRHKELEPRLERLADTLYRHIPSGVGTSGQIRLGKDDLKNVLEHGSRWAVEQGYGRAEDLETTEENGEIAGASADVVTKHARERGTPQLGTLGAGNHFIEIGVVDEVYDAEAARVMGLEEEGQVVLWIHSGSRGFGHQVADDYIKIMLSAMPKYKISVPDRQLACAPVNSAEGRDYLAAMRCAANYAWANRQVMMHLARQAFAEALGMSQADLGLELIYDVAHNIAKIETHEVDGRKKRLCVHRKGATRSFPAGHPDVPAKYASIGQPVLIPGDMGRYSYIMTGTQTAMEQTFGSTCHGAGRMKSRIAAKKSISGRDFARSLEQRGIAVRTGSMAGLAEEASGAYKNIEDVIEVAHQAGLSHKVARTRPAGVIKG